MTKRSGRNEEVGRVSSSVHLSSRKPRRSRPRGHQIICCTGVADVIEVGSVSPPVMLVLLGAFRFVVSRRKVFKDSIFLIALALEYMGFWQFQITPRFGYFSMFQFGNNKKRWHKTQAHLRSDQVQSHVKQRKVSIAYKKLTKNWLYCHTCQ